MREQGVQKEGERDRKVHKDDEVAALKTMVITLAARVELLEQRLAEQQQS